MSEQDHIRGQHAPLGLTEARSALITWIREAGTAGRQFLQVHLRASEEGRFAVRHWEDREHPAVELQLITDPFAAREIAQTTADGAHRPLKTSPNLRTGWRFEALSDRDLWTVLDYLYPACVNHWHAGRTGTLQPTHWRETAERQSGMYAPVRLLEDGALQDAVRACCAASVCLRRVAWGVSEDHPEPIATEDTRPEEDSAYDQAVVPCPEACSLFISFARTVLQTERTPRVEVDGFGQLNQPEVQQIRELVTSAAGGMFDAPREGEFDLPLNQRRLRYLAIRLERAEEEQRAAGAAAEETDA